MNSLAVINLRDTFFGEHGGAGGTAATITESPGTLISKLLPNIVVIAGVTFFLVILWGGWDMIFGAGREAKPAELEKAWHKITYGLVGFLLVAVAYFILQIIQTSTGINFITPNI